MLGRRLFLRLLSLLAFVLPLRLHIAAGQTTGSEPVIVPLEKLKSAWDSVTFKFGSTPGIAVRLPGGSQVVVSRVCPHERCFADLVKSPAQVFRETTYEPAGPVLVCPCHASVFDLLDGGKVLFGPAPRPLARMKFRVEGDKLVITGMEGS